jgi:hypothetical protein
LDCLGSNLAEDHVLEVEEGTGCECDEESAIVCVFVTHAAEQSGSVVGKFKGLISEGRSVDGAIALGEVPQFDEGPGDEMMKVIANEGKAAILVLGSSKEQSLEVLSGSRYSIFEELHVRMRTLK